ncbi:MAG TPA: hypothetical protein VLA16_13970 [Ideonella sp.]|nr:hypothetical protein [Ideonella sp.]
MIPATRHRLAALLVTLLIAGCAAVSKVEVGQTLVGDRLVIQVDSAWNRFERGLADNTPTWTQEGITVDALQFYPGVKDGEEIAPPLRDGQKKQPLTFKASMQPVEIVALFQALHSRDGSSFELQKIEPAEFVGVRGFRCEFAVIRKIDDVRLRGMAYGAVRDGRLYLISYTAPRLGFYAKYAARAEAIARSASLKS